MEDYPSLHKTVMTKVIMVRHGQSIANLEGRFAGYSNFDLTDLGRAQAALAAKYLHDVLGEKIDVIYSSDLLRAHNTAVPFAEIYGLPINDTEELREIYAGKWEGLTFTEIEELYHDGRAAWLNDFSNSRCTDGESTREVYRRVVAKVTALARENLGKTVLITSHATPVRAIDCFSHGWGEERIGDVIFVKNSAISIFEYNEETNSMSPILVGSTEHLEESMTTSLPATV